MSTGAAPEGPPPWRVWARRLGPFVIAGLVVFAILRQYKVEDIVARMREGNASPLVPLGIVAMCSILVILMACDGTVMRSALGGPGWLDVARGKAGTSVLMTLGYGFGHSGYALWIARATGASLPSAAGLVLYIISSDLAAVSWIATASMWLGGAKAHVALKLAAPAVAVVMTSLLLLGGSLFGAPGGGTRLQFFHAWRTVPRGPGALQILGRIVFITLLITITWVATRAFGLSIPLTVMLTYMPVISIVASLPINVAGFGAVQGAWLLLSDWAPPTSLLAFQFLWQLSCGVGVLVRGAPFLRRVIAEIDEGRVREQAAADLPRAA